MYRKLKHLTSAALIGWCVLLGLPGPASAGPMQQGGGDDSQRVDLLGQQGGPVTGAIHLDNGLVLAAEGSSLAVIAMSAGSSEVVERRDLGHGEIVDLARCGDGMCALTVEGVVTMSGADNFGMPTPAGFAPGGGQAIAAQGDLAVIAARQAGLRILRIGPGGAIGAETDLTLPGAAVDVALDRANNRAFVASGEAGVIVVSLAEPPSVGGAMDAIKPADAVGLSGKLLAVASGRRVLLIDPASGGQGAVGVYAPINDGRRMVIDGAYAYVADAHDGLKILWLAGALRPVQVYGEADRPAQDVAVDKDTVYVAGLDGLRIYDASSRYRPLQIAGLPLPAAPKGITLADTRAFISLGEQGIAVVDVSNQSAPQITRVIALSGPAGSSAFSDGTLYVAAGDAGLAVIDANTPGGEALISTLPLPGPALDVAARDYGVYVAAGEAGLVSVDIQRRQLPVIASVLPPSAGQSDRTITIAGKRGYVTQGDRFVIADVSHPKSMGVLGTVRVPANHVAASDIYLYALGGDQIAMYDARATAEPIYQQAYRGLRQASRIGVYGARAFISSAGDGPDLIALDLSAPDAPVELDNAGETGHTYHPDAGPEFVTLPAGSGGVRLFSLTEGGALKPEGDFSAVSDASPLADAGGTLLTGGQLGWSLADASSGEVRQSVAGATVRALAVDADTAVLAGEEGSLEVYSLSGTRRPQHRAERQTTSPANGLALSPEYVFAADPDGLSIYNRRNLAQAQRISLPSPPQAVGLANGAAYLPMANGSLAIVDVGDPTGGIRIVGSAPTPRPAALILGPDGIIYALADTSLRRLALGDLAHPAALTVGSLPQVGVRGLFFNGLLAAFTPGEALRFYDPKSIAAGTVSFYGQINLNAQDITAGWPLAFAAYGDGGLGIVDIPNRQTNPPFFGEPVDALAQDGNTLLAAGTSLTAWDISQPDQPKQIAALPLDFRGRHIDPAPGGNWLISTGGGLVIAHWDGSSLSQIGAIELAGAADRATQIGGRGYVALHDGGLLVADLADPAKPAGLFTLTSNSGRFVNDILRLDDNHLLVSWDGAVDVIDISTPANPPHLAGTFLLGGTATGIRIDQDGKRAVLPMGEQGAAILDLADPHQPKLTGRIETPGQALAAQADGSTLYVADGTCGLRVFDVADPAAPHETGYWRGGYASDVLIMPDGGPQPPVILASGSQVARVRYNPAAPAVLPPAPQNPEPALDAGSAPIALTLKWGPPADPCNPLKYDVYFGQEENPPLLGSVTGDPHIEVPQLTPHGQYTWHVDATDPQGDKISGPEWRFTTAGADYPNGYPPSPPLFLAWVEDHPVVSAILAILFLLIPGAIVLRGLARQSAVGLPSGRARREDDVPDWYESGRDVGEMEDESTRRDEKGN